MKQLIIYGSIYGTTKSYAEKFSEMTKNQAITFEEIKDLSEYEEIIHFGGLYAGGVKGLKNTIKLMPENAHLIIITVGLADVTNKENSDHIKESIYQQVPKSILERTKIYHLRGGIDYRKLSFLHKAMMYRVYKKAKNMPKEKQTPEVQNMIETYNKKADFVDFNGLSKIIDECLHL